MKTIVKKTLALLLVFAMTFGSVGGYVKAADDTFKIDSVSVDVESLTTSGGEVVVTVSGTELLSQSLYYRVQYATSVNATGGYSTLIKKIDIPTPSVKESCKVTFTITVPAASDAKKYIIGVCGTTPTYSSKEILVSESTAVDKTALNESIDKATAEVSKSDVYTSDSLSALQDAIDSAQKVADNTSATSTDVEKAISNLQDAINNLEKLPVSTEPGTITKVTLSTDSVVSGGALTVNVEGTNLRNKIYWKLRKTSGEDTGVVAPEVRSSSCVSTEDGTKATFTIPAPENNSDQDATYQILVKSENPDVEPVGKDYSEYGLGILYQWGTTLTADFTVKSPSSSNVPEPGIDKSSLEAAINTANAKKESEYTESSWTAMREKLTTAININNNEQSTQEQVNTATDELTAALEALQVQPAAKITGASLSVDAISAKGGSVTLNVLGENLSSKNWKVTYTRANSDTLSTVAGDVESIDYSSTSATIYISRNKMVNPVEFNFTVSSLGDSSSKVEDLKLTQEAKDYSSESVNPSSVYLASSNSVVAEFDQTISAADTVDELKKLIYVSDNSDSDAQRLTLGAEDSVTVDGNKVTITYTKELSLNSQSNLYIYIKEGALKLEDNKIAKDIKWSISSDAKIASVELEQSVYDHNGGNVTAILSGYNTDKIDLSTVSATVTVAGDLSTDASIPVKVSMNEGKLTAAFTVPANATKNTISYILKVYQDGSPVYGDAASSRGDKTVVSVLPSGKTAEDISFSSASISSGSNKVADDNDADLVLETPSSEGSFKTEFRIYGTNLDASKTKVRAIDENGIIWPVWHITTCDGEARFVSLGGEYSNGTFGSGNSQLIEILPPKYVGTNKIYTFEVSVDGENYVNTGVTLKVKNSSMSSNESFKDCTSANYKYLTVKYVDESGKEIAEAVSIKGYYYSMILGQDYKAKEISGYTLVSEPKVTEDDFFCNGKTIQYVYKSTSSNSGSDNKDNANNNGNAGNASNSSVKTVKVSAISVSAISKKIAAGKKIQLTATVSPSNASNKAVTWSTSNKKYATVSATGKVTVKAAGAGKTVTITATAKDGSGIKQTYKISIMKNAVKSIKLSAAKTVKAGKSVSVKATVKTTGTKVNKKLKWTSSNTKYATVNSKGKVTAKKAGKGKTVKITATATDGSGKKATVKIKIK